MIRKFNENSITILTGYNKNKTPIFGVELTVHDDKNRNKIISEFKTICTDIFSEYHISFEDSTEEKYIEDENILCDYVMVSSANDKLLYELKFVHIGKNSRYKFIPKFVTLNLKLNYAIPERRNLNE